jgi:hypothetical protein
VKNRSTSTRSTVLLLGAGTGEATCGILYVASYLRRGGVEAYVRLTDDDETPAAQERSLGELLAHLRPRVVGVSLKWFHHVSRGLRMARLIKRLDPEVRVVFGGNSATSWWRELLSQGCVDDVVLGDGEGPFLSLCRGDAEPPNVVSRGATTQPAHRYVQGVSSADVHYSHFETLFLSRLDLRSYSGWVAPGKGCGENCLYCGGTRGLQKATFGRAKPFLRPVESVQRDHREVVPHTWQLRYDFAGSTAAFLEQAWGEVDLSRHATTYFLWGVPPPELAETLSRRFGRVYMVLDIGCFSEAQRLETLKRGLLKPCPTDRELFEVIERCKQLPNLELEVSGIAGLPFANHLSLSQERKLVRRVLEAGCTIGYQRLESQPGALVTEHPGRFGMVSEATTFEQFVSFFDAQEPGDRGVPMVRYADAKLEDAVQRTADEVDAEAWAAMDRRARVDLRPRSRLISVAAREEVSLGDWLGAWRVPAKLRATPLTVVRGETGQGFTAAPHLSARQFESPALQQGPEAEALLAVLGAFERATPVERALDALRRQAGLDASLAREAVEHLAAGRFLKVV